MLAIVVNENACLPVIRGALEFIANMLAPTGRESITVGHPALDLVDFALDFIGLGFIV